MASNRMHVRSECEAHRRLTVERPCDDIATVFARHGFEE